MLLGSERRESLTFNLTPSREACGSDMLDNLGKPCDFLPGDSGSALLGSERRESLASNLTPSRQACGSDMLDNVGQPHSFKGSVWL